MKTYKNVCLIGTSHIARQSISEVQKYFKNLNPEIVAIELDKRRAYALINKSPKPSRKLILKKFGIKGFLFFSVGQFIQEKFGKLVNIEPGSEMAEALALAQGNNSQVFFIDRDIESTLSRLSRNLKKREILKMIFDIASGLFKREKIEIDFSKVPEQELIEKVLEQTKNRYPSLYKVLIQERDYHMAGALHHLSALFPEKKILAVVGAGHIKGILDRLSQLEHREVA